MANDIIFTDGFDHYTNPAYKWDVLVTGGGGSFGGAAFSGPTIIPGSGRGGAGALYILIGQWNGGATASYVQKNVGTQTQMYFGMAVKYDPSIQNVDTPILRFCDGTTVQVQLYITSSGSLYFTNGSGTALGSGSSSPFPTNSYHYIEAFVVINNTTGSVQLRIDQAVVINAAAINTRVSGNNSLNVVQMGCFSAGGGSTPAQGPYTWFDDAYLDLLGYNGDVRINGQLPTGNGSTNNFSNVAATWVLSTATPLQTTIADSNGNLQRCTANTGDTLTGAGSHPTWSSTIGITTTDNHVTWTCLSTGSTYSQYQLVNETSPDGDNSYISDNTANDISRFTYPAVPGTAIKAVMIWAFAKKDDGGYRSIQGSIKSGSSTATTGTDVPLGGNYQYLLMQSTTDPNTSAAWTSAGVSAAEFGIKITN